MDVVQIITISVFLFLPEALTGGGGNLMCHNTPPYARQKRCSPGKPCIPSELLACYSGICCARNLRAAAVLKKPISQGSDSEDVTIIGAGIAGTFTAWRLRNLGLNIGVYEYSDRVGGRMYTERFYDAPDINIELGAMRLVPEAHRRMIKAANELGLHLIPFVEGKGNIPEKTLLYLRNHRLRTFDLGGPKTPYFLRVDERLSPSDLERQLSVIHTNYSGYGGEQELFEAVTVQDNIPLYKQSYLEAFHKMASREAYQYLFDTQQFHFSRTHASAAFEIPRDPYPSEKSSDELVTIAEGLNAYPMTFLQRFIYSNIFRHKFRLNRQLVEVCPADNGKYKLTFQVTQTVDGLTRPLNLQEIVYTKNLILAIPKVPLQRIDFGQFDSINFQKALESVEDARASKVFLLYDYPWWRHIPLNFTYTLSDLPYRQSYDFGVSTTGRGVLLVSYADDEDVQFWRQLQNEGEVISRRRGLTQVTDQVVRHAHRQLSQVYDVHNIPKPIDGIMITWDSYPFNGGWGVWKPEYNMINVKRYLTKPFVGENVYIVHGHYAPRDNVGWGEGALEAADQVLAHFGILPY